MIDCGTDWAGRVAALDPDVIVLTHAHDDHAAGLKSGAPCLVCATNETWQHLSKWPVPNRQIIQSRQPTAMLGMLFEAVPVEHSLRCPAVAYRITAGRASILYAPDVAAFLDLAAAMAGIDLYIGDGASLRRPILRRRGGHLIGHAPVLRQLEWCRQQGVRRVHITHCGSEVVRNHSQAQRLVQQWGRDRGLAALIVHDGMTLELRPPKPTGP
jgi:phosphoribosyl 1,2-cyclic phosphodiesterase